MICAWDVWARGVMMVAVCPAMHFALAGLGGAAGLGEVAMVPIAVDMRSAWEFAFEAPADFAEYQVEVDDESYPPYQGDQEWALSND